MEILGDLEAAKAFGIKVCSTPDGPTEAVAELSLGAMLCLLRMLVNMNDDLHSGKWNKKIFPRCLNTTPYKTESTFFIS